MPGDGRRHVELEQPFPDVPTHLADALYEWVRTYLDNDVLMTRNLVLDQRLEASHSTHGQLLSAAMEWVDEEPTNVLTAIEYILENENHFANNSHFGRVEYLADLLTRGNSLYAVRDDARGLEVRTTPETKRLVSDAVAMAEGVGSVATHLAAAWNAAFSVNPDARTAYAEAVFAVEGASIPVVIPNQAKPQLGHVIGELAKPAAPWALSIAADDGYGIETVVAMLRTLWTGQTRHAGLDPTTPETVEAAQAAVFLAATLVQWFVAGTIRKAG